MPNNVSILLIEKDILATHCQELYKYQIKILYVYTIKDCVWTHICINLFYHFLLHVFSTQVSIPKIPITLCKTMLENCSPEDW